MSRMYLVNLTFDWNLISDDDVEKANVSRADQIFTLLATGAADMTGWFFAPGNTNLFLYLVVYHNVYLYLSNTLRYLWRFFVFHVADMVDRRYVQSHTSQSGLSANKHSPGKEQHIIKKIVLTDRV